MADRLLFLIALPVPTESVTALTFTPLPQSMVYVPAADLLPTNGRILVTLTAKLLPAANQSLEMVLAIEDDGGRLTQLTGGVIRASAGANPQAVTMTGAIVDVTANLQRQPNLGLRLLGRVTGGTGTFRGPTLAVRGRA